MLSQSRETLIVPGATTLMVCVLNVVPLVDTVPLNVLVRVAVSALGAETSAIIATSRMPDDQRRYRCRTPRRLCCSVNLERSHW